MARRFNGRILTKIANDHGGVRAGRLTVCGKTGWPSKALALHVMARITAGDDPETPNKIPRRTYACDRCGYWHLTSLRRPTSGPSGSRP